VPTYRLVTLGCKLNQADSGEMEARLRALGLTPAPDRSGADGVAGVHADLVVLNTCTVTARADTDARRAARRLRRAHPRALLIATGCLAERDAAALRSIASIDHVVGMARQAERVERIAAAAFGRPEEPPAHRLGPHGATDACGAGAVLQSTGADDGRTRALLKIQDGCNLACSYCIIPAVRGRSRSLPPDEVLRRLAALSAAGFREIVFTGVNSGDYGKDLDPPVALHDMLRQAIRRPGLGRRRLNSLEPRTVTPEIVGLLAGSGGLLARHLQIPLQSGCDAVLRAMRRPYRAADYDALLQGLRRTIPAIGLGADVIVGFPGETDAQFEETRRFIADSPLNYLHVFSYSVRPGTPAAGRPDRIDPEIIRERSRILRSLGAELSLRFRRSFLGRTLPVLTLRDRRPDGRLRALSDNFIEVDLDPSGGSMSNRLLEARVTAVEPARTLASVA